jgi:hypothetical protein
MKFQNRVDLLSIIPKNCVFAELGVFIGSYSEIIINTVEPSKMYLVDIFGKGNAHSSGTHVNDLSEYYDILCKKYQKNEQVKVIKSLTSEFLNRLQENYLDAVYIDADHTYEAVKQDLENSYPKVKNNGYIMGHDFDRPEIQKAVEEFCDRNRQKIFLITDEPQPSFVIKKEN